MSYGDDGFWAAYEAYVNENIDRHAKAIQKLGWFFAPVLDLGCGRVMEGRQLLVRNRAGVSYRGVDVDPVERKDVLAADYRTELGTVATWLEAQEFLPATVLSMFSAEVSGNAKANAELYANVFATFPSVERIISAGFYYESRKTELTVGEVGGLTSFQTIGPLLPGEYRLLERGPSTLFGADVVEVWRLLRRHVEET